MGKIFKQKNYTLAEGHYTGPKDMEEVPGTFKVVGGATLAGYGAGVIADEALKDSRKPVLGDEPSSWATRGAGAGFVAGVMAKLLLNTMHNPMDNMKFSELDQSLRKHFGMYRVSGVTVGDSRANRDRMKESFVINSRSFTDYKINVCIAKGKFVMYTLGLDPKQIDAIDETLDYYCKKYYGMKYTSTPIGNDKSKGSWAVTITFTNYQVAANFLVELSEVLGIRINLLDNDISTELADKTFSEVPALDKVELSRIFIKGALNLMVSGGYPRKSAVILQMISEGLDKLKTPEKAAIGIKNPRENYGNKYLESVMKKLGGQWTAGENGRDLNIYLNAGTLIVCSSQGFSGEKTLQGIKEFTEVKSPNTSASMFTYRMESTGGLEVVLKKLLPLKPNIYVP